MNRGDPTTRARIESFGRAGEPGQPREFTILELATMVKEPTGSKSWSGS